MLIECTLNAEKINIQIDKKQNRSFEAVLQSIYLTNLMRTKYFKKTIISQAHSLLYQN